MVLTTVARVEIGFEDAMAVVALPEPVRRSLRTTNVIERLNREFHRRERVIVAHLSLIMEWEVCEVNL